MRETINKALKEAQAAGDKRRIATLRLIQAAIRDRDVAARSNGGDGVGEREILDMLQTMVRQRDVSAREFEEMGQLDLAEQEREESAIIREYLPHQIEGDTMQALCAETVNSLEAHGLRDIGRCMSALKERYPGQMDFVKASCMMKDILRENGANGATVTPIADPAAAPGPDQSDDTGR